MNKIKIFARRIIKAPVLVLLAVASRVQHFKMYEKWWVPQKFNTLFGLYEKETTLFFKKHVKKGMTVVDAGANVGYYTRLFSKLVGPQGKVYAFEPDTEAYAFLQYNTERFPNVKIFPYAVSDKEGEKTFYHIPRSTQSHTLVPTENAETSIVRTIAIDTFIPEPIDIIKIDTEGSEDQVFAGMRQHVASPMMAVFEYTINGTEPLAEELMQTGDLYAISKEGDMHSFSETDFRDGGRGGNHYANIVYRGRI